MTAEFHGVTDILHRPLRLILRYMQYHTTTKEGKKYGRLEGKMCKRIGREKSGWNKKIGAKKEMRRDGGVMEEGKSGWDKKE